MHNGPTHALAKFTPPVTIARTPLARKTPRHLPKDNKNRLEFARVFPILASFGSRGDQGRGAYTVMTRILLAEDDESMRRFLVRALEKAGYAVVAFGNGAEAYERLKEEPFTLLLTDIVMPEMDGIELARKATELDPGLKIMFITGFAAVTLNTDNQAPKNARVLSKPFHLRDLVNEVDRLLAA